MCQVRALSLAGPRVKHVSEITLGYKYIRPSRLSTIGRYPSRRRIIIIIIIPARDTYTRWQYYNIIYKNSTGRNCSTCFVSVIRIHIYIYIIIVIKYNITIISASDFEPKTRSPVIKPAGKPIAVALQQYTRRT